MIGDFNALLTMTDKYGDQQGSNSHVVVFWKFVQFIRGLDISFKRHPYSGTNKKVWKNNIQERLDRAIFYPNWPILYSRAGYII